MPPDLDCFRRLVPLSTLHERSLLTLATSTRRNADVVMLTDGRLMRLSEEDFLALLKQRLLRKIDLRQTFDLFQRGAVRVDVRAEEEFKLSEIKGALNIPLYLLRFKIPRLDRSRSYIVYCDTGERSAVAAFVMAQQGFDVYVLKGGLIGMNRAVGGAPTGAEPPGKEAGPRPIAAHPKPPSASLLAPWTRARRRQGRAQRPVSPATRNSQWLASIASSTETAKA